MNKQRNVLAGALERQGLERHPGEAAPDIFVEGRGLTAEAPRPATKIQALQVGYSGKPARPPKYFPEYRNRQKQRFCLSSNFKTPSAGHTEK